VFIVLLLDSLSPTIEFLHHVAALLGSSGDTHDATAL
jgi:hypothetical protein